MRSHFYSVYQIRKGKRGKNQHLLNAHSVPGASHTLPHFLHKIHIWGWYRAFVLGYKEAENRNVIWMCLKSWAKIQTQKCCCVLPLHQWVFTPCPLCAGRHWRIWGQPWFDNVDCECGTLGSAKSPDPKLTHPSTHYMALGKSLHLGSISSSLNWGMMSGRLPGLRNIMIKCM